MTAKEIKKLETIIAKLETLQNQLDDRNVRSEMERARAILMDIWNKA